jgi:hypothetical protein
MSISVTFGNLPPTAKSPKSPKGIIIENPLLKNAQFSYGGSALTTQRTSSALQTMPRSPLLAVTPNRDNMRQQHHLDHKTKSSLIATPGPPPKMSLSLMGGAAMPMQVSRKEHRCACQTIEQCLQTVCDSRRQKRRRMDRESIQQHNFLR